MSIEIIRAAVNFHYRTWPETPLHAWMLEQVKAKFMRQIVKENR